MTTPNEKLAQSLEILKKLQENRVMAIRSADISRVHRERLIKNGFLKEIFKGWYIPFHPTGMLGETTIWYSSFWGFCVAYFKARFDNDWCLSPEQSLLLHVENWNVPRQLIVRTPKGNNKITMLLLDTSILDVRYKMPNIDEIEVKQGLNIFSVASALILCSPKFFTQYPSDMRAILASVQDASEILKLLLAGGHSTIANRLVGAFRNIGNNIIANNIAKTMIAVGYDIREIDPFQDTTDANFTSLNKSPYVNRIQAMWHSMRKDIINRFPKAPAAKIQIDKYLADVDEKYLSDAYHSLSIEGYNVSEELIDKVRSGKWNPDYDDNDKELKNALAARGYWQAFQCVKNSLQHVLNGENAGQVAKNDHSDWFKELFQPNIPAGILRMADLAGYRDTQVYILGSKHIPPNKSAVRELMPVLFELLKNETEPSVRVVLGHFFFVYIHPYMDGNGRIGRFLMNVMFASGGYPWLIIPVEQRQPYMQALEQASVHQNIIPFCDFLCVLLRQKE